MYFTKIIQKVYAESSGAHWCVPVTPCTRRRKMGHDAFASNSLRREEKRSCSFVHDITAGISMQAVKGASGQENAKNQNLEKEEPEPRQEPTNQTPKQKQEFDQEGDDPRMVRRPPHHSQR
jgi:hypothetical protein